MYLKFHDKIEWKNISELLSTFETSLFKFVVMVTINLNSMRVLTVSSQPSTLFSVKVTDRSFRCADHTLKLVPKSFDEPHPQHSSYSDQVRSPFSSISLSITPSVFHSRLKSSLFNKSFSL